MTPSVFTNVVYKKSNGPKIYSNTLVDKGALTTDCSRQLWLHCFFQLLSHILMDVSTSMMLFSFIQETELENKHKLRSVIRILKDIGILMDSNFIYASEYKGTFLRSGAKVQR
ncbi:hypothetical protein XELAEV_18024018mg [Xenopus laevis]|uniref:Uncharacterized protein n=1 Tax=Xenopus laevis TaxID=8355 RepID=A0A974HPQ3_XENLA|nr:hypothetical protein XELAEV_18024018mg [Xenopus laevis]